MLPSLKKGRRLSRLKKRAPTVVLGVGSLLLNLQLLLDIDLENAAVIEEGVHLFLDGVGVIGHERFVNRRIVMGELGVIDTHAVIERQILKRSY